MRYQNVTDILEANLFENKCLNGDRKFIFSEKEIHLAFQLVEIGKKGDWTVAISEYRDHQAEARLACGPPMATPRNGSEEPNGLRSDGHYGR